MLALPCLLSVALLFGAFAPPMRPPGKPLYSDGRVMGSIVPTGNLSFVTVTCIDSSAAATVHHFTLKESTLVDCIWHQDMPPQSKVRVLIALRSWYYTVADEPLCITTRNAGDYIAWLQSTEA